jgi:hypothetical protein
MTTTPKNFLKTLTIIHYALVSGPLLTGIIFYLNTELNTNGTVDDIFVYIFPLIALGGIFAGNFIFKKLLSNIKKNENLQHKLAGYQTASLVKFALLEGPAFLNIIWFSQTGNLLYLTIGMVLVLFLFMQRPTKIKVESDLELIGEHKRQFNRLDDPIL